MDKKQLLEEVNLLVRDIRAGKIDTRAPDRLGLPEDVMIEVLVIAQQALEEWNAIQESQRVFRGRIEGYLQKRRGRKPSST